MAARRVQRGSLLLPLLSVAVLPSCVFSGGDGVGDRRPSPAGYEKQYLYDGGSRTEGRADDGNKHAWWFWQTWGTGR